MLAASATRSYWCCKSPSLSTAMRLSTCCVLACAKTAYYSVRRGQCEGSADCNATDLFCWSSGIDTTIVLRWLAVMLKGCRTLKSCLFIDSILRIVCLRCRDTCVCLRHIRCAKHIA